jgi:hypothetical protein
MGVSASEVEKRLSILGKDANVANLSLVYQGRNAQWAVLDELYKTKNPRVLVVQFDENPSPTGHPWFPYFAPSLDVALPPSIFLRRYLPDVSFLPLRQMELFLASVFPDLLGFRRAFDPVAYAKIRNDFTTSFVDTGDNFVDMERETPPSKLISVRDEYKKTQHSERTPRLVADIIDADDHIYLDKIARLASDHGTRVLMLYLPDFDSNRLGNSKLEYFSKFGKVLDYSDLSTRSSLFVQWTHLNHAGAMIVSDRIADALAPQL